MLSNTHFLSFLYPLHTYKSPLYAYKKVRERKVDSQLASGDLVLFLFFMKKKNRTVCHPKFSECGCVCVQKALQGLCIYSEQLHDFTHLSNCSKNISAHIFTQSSKMTKGLLCDQND